MSRRPSPLPYQIERGVAGPGMAISYRCLDCPGTFSQVSAGRFIRGTRIFRCHGCWDKRQQVKAA